MKTTFLGNNGLLASIGITLFLFFFIFGMPTPIGSLTPLLTMSIVLWALLNYKKYFLFIPKEIFYLFIFLIFDLLVCLIIPCILGTYDFSIIQTKINFIASLLATYILARSFSSNNNITDKQFFNLLLVIFSIQVILIVGMLINSDFSQAITSFTRNSDQGARVLESYAGARGLGIADSSAFGFAIVMGLLIFLTFFAYKNNFISFKYFIVLLLLGSVASISAGRTAVLGIMFGLVYLLLNFKNYRSLLTLISIFLFFILIGSILISIDRNSIENETLGYFYSYSMEPILNYINEGSFASTSTDALQNMYFPLTEQQYLIGDGRYMDGESYYMATDAGYMRFTLFYGGVFSLMFYSYFIYFTMKLIFIKKNNIILLLFLLVISLALHYKGEVVLFSISYNKVLFLILFFIYMKSIGINKKA
ncbi:hypothetical protein QDS99_002703 [Acinetobacter baumannii]|uniref:hypothetical protein n=1 Tax=Acinetobacter baumannii TaxID=470 RepID=UPI00028694A4|nr:hypothetical protein [Acinetobacter baumannii]AGQ12465.1 hypothetical protein BJAB07104_00094 [Acinetobacter baumannii BJAB07104]AML68952.1 hypothetical protein AYR68_18535 [Acinetobacter baumannii]APM50751.1 hypothetical protein BS615_19095 [Acinetobacter baumannii]ATU54399.1 hypothetical protein CTZ18_18555 [Acinetobacter baumannii]AVE91949.1 hypothetical protein C5B74_18620 [Acinetobacter baumannii]